ncbi:hypothetical protein [Pectobacterium cacticida]|uniref:hypothetical protein n=1 Tax=Pectobacterium cacticida TaxID=69221 RepID=UPI0039889C4A
MFYTMKSNKAAAFFVMPIFSLSTPHVIGVLVWAIGSGIDISSGLEKKEVCYV